MWKSCWVFKAYRKPIERCVIYSTAIHSNMCSRCSGYHICGVRKTGTKVEIVVEYSPYYAAMGVNGRSDERPGKEDSRGGYKKAGIPWGEGIWTEGWMWGLGRR